MSGVRVGWDGQFLLAIVTASVGAHESRGLNLLLRMTSFPYRHILDNHQFHRKGGLSRADVSQLRVERTKTWKYGK